MSSAACAPCSSHFKCEKTCEQYLPFKVTRGLP